MKVQVLAADIKNGIHRSRQSCMTALAFRRVLKNRLIGVGMESVTYWNEDFRWINEKRLPPEVIQKIYDWEGSPLTGKIIEEFEFDIEI